MTRAAVRARSAWPIAATLAWGAAVCAGMGVLVDHAVRPGPTGAVPALWPAASRVPGPGARPVLLMFAHPRCPCTRASLAALERTLARCPDCAAVTILVARPAGSDPSWDTAGLPILEAAVPGVAVMTDEGGAEALRFGARVSGHTVVYGRDGRLAYSGGITAARGHEGDNEGFAAVVALLSGRRAGRAVAPVFGCALSAAPAGEQGA